jgi:hypothetical protein
LKDQLIRLNPITAGAPCREDLRSVTLWDERNQCEVKLLNQPTTLAVKRLGKKLGRISVEELEQVIDGLNEIVGP